MTFHPRKPLASLCLAAAVTLALGSAAPGSLAQTTRYESVEPHMGTLGKIVVYAADEAHARRAFRAGFERIRELDEALSDYKPASEVNRLVETAVGTPVTIGRDLFTVLQAAQELAAATDGAFDVTQGPVIRLWREARRTGRLPDPAQLLEAADRTGFRKLHLDAASRTVTLDRHAMSLDLGAIGKGYAASEALKALAHAGIRSALVALSGDIACSEAPPGTAGWRIAVHAEGDFRDGVPAVLPLTNVAVSTAGADEQHLDVQGRRYSHIVDPSTRMGVTDDLTVTVVADHGLEADGLDTAMSVLGAERGLALADGRPSAAALVIRRTASGTALLPSVRFRELVAGKVRQPPGPAAGVRTP